MPDNLLSDVLRSTDGVDIRQVAERAGVAPSTVSRVLSGGYASPETRARVMKVVRRLNYQPNRIASSLRARRRTTVGMVIPEISNPFFSSITDGAQEVFADSGLSLLLTSSSGDPAKEKRNVETLRAERVAGIVFTQCSDDVRCFHEAARSGVAAVAIARRPARLKVDTVTVDYAGGTYSAISHLLSAGHRRIGFITGPEWSSSVQERQIGFQRALQEFKVKPSAAPVIAADFRQSGGYQAMSELLSMPNPPTAVFVGNNVMTLGALEAIHGRRLRIPEDVAIAYFDDFPWSAAFSPALTAIALPTVDVGRSAAQLLLDRIREPQRPVRDIVLATKLIVRESCGLPEQVGVQSGRKARKASAALAELQT